MQRSVVDNAVHELHVVGSVYIRFDAIKTLKLILVVISHIEGLVLVAIVRDTVSSVACTFCNIGLVSIRVSAAITIYLLPLANLVLLTARTIDAKKLLDADPTDLLVKYTGLLGLFNLSIDTLQHLSLVGHFFARLLHIYVIHISYTHRAFTMG